MRISNPFLLKKSIGSDELPGEIVAIFDEPRENDMVFDYQVFRVPYRQAHERI